MITSLPSVSATLNSRNEAALMVALVTSHVPTDGGILTIVHCEVGRHVAALAKVTSYNYASLHMQAFDHTNI
jgi:hypothetical protein